MKEVKGFLEVFMVYLYVSSTVILLGFGLYGVGDYIFNNINGYRSFFTWLIGVLFISGLTLLVRLSDDETKS